MSDVSEVFLEPGEILYAQGDHYDSVYIIESGELVMYADEDGARTFYERRGEGSIVGELSVLMRQPRNVTIEAVQPTRLFRIAAEHIMRRADQLDDVLRACIDTSVKFSQKLHSDVPAGSDVPLVKSTLRDPAGMIEQMRMEQDLIAGIGRDEFDLAYQPIMDMNANRIVGFEALMRWRHPRLGPVPPFQFILMAEAVGAISDLTVIALEKACAALGRLNAGANAAQPLYMTVNISGHDLERDDFVDTVRHIADKHDVAPRDLKLELTETALVRNPAVAIGHLDMLRASGFGVSIDDFGVGYSNLVYLKQLSFNTLKIDRAFAGEAHADPVSRSIVRMILTLGEELGVDVVAEGVETPEDVETLRELGCRLAQGYHYAEPASEAAVLELLRSGALNGEVLRGAA